MMMLIPEAWQNDPLMAQVGTDCLFNTTNNLLTSEKNTKKNLVGLWDAAMLTLVGLQLF